jgi:SIR2-like domain
VVSDKIGSTGSLQAAGARPLSGDDWRLILRRMRSELCVPFLGAGASLGTRDQPGLPTARQLAEALARECEFPGADTGDFLRVAQYFAMSQDEAAVREAIDRELRVRNLQPGTVHRSIAALPIPYVLTTNFDNLMERAFEAAGKTPQVAAYEIHGKPQELDRATADKPLVYKLHGSLAKPTTMIATEDDVIEFLSCLLLGDPGLPPQIKQLFENASLLFVGYGLKDWNIRVLLRAMRGRRTNDSGGVSSGVDSFAIQRRPEEASLAAEWEKAIIYWNRRESLRCFDIDAIVFAEELERRFKEAGECR